LVGAVGGPTPTIGHGILSQSDEVEDSGFNVGFLALGKRDLRGLALAGPLDLERIVVSSAPFKISITSVSSEGYGTWQDNLEIAGLPHWKSKHYGTSRPTCCSRYVVKGSPIPRETTVQRLFGCLARRAVAFDSRSSQRANQLTNKVSYRPVPPCLPPTSSGRSSDSGWPASSGMTPCNST
jgi:hypothetical protein